MIVIPPAGNDSLALLACSVVFAVLPTIFVVLRVIARRVAHRKYDAADHMIIVALFMTVGLAVTCILEVLYGGFGRHRVDIVSEFGEGPITAYHIIILPLELCYTLSISLAKLSLLFLYIKVFPVSWVTTVSKGTCIFIGLYAVSGVLTTCLICQPIEYNWDRTLVAKGGHCGSQKAVFGIYGVLNLITDVMVLGLPIPSLLGLKLPTLRKIGLVTTFAVGFLTCVASVIRLAFLTSMDYFDITSTGIPFVLMTVVEPSLAVSLACVPLLRPLLPKTNTRYSATGTAEHVVSLSFRGLDSCGSSAKTAPTGCSIRDSSFRRTRGRSSAASVPAPILQYQYEIGLLKSSSSYPGDHELTTTTMTTTRKDGAAGGYLYQAEISACPSRGRADALADADGAGTGLAAQSGGTTTTAGPDGANILVRQEWSVSNEAKGDGPRDKQEEV